MSIGQPGCPPIRALLWDALVDLARKNELAPLFSHCVSLTVNAVREPHQPRRDALRHADTLAAALSLDMTAAGWTTTADNYLGRVTKAQIIDAVREAKGDDTARLIEHLKKGDMAKEAQRLLRGHGLAARTAPHAGSQPRRPPPAPARPPEPPALPGLPDRRHRSSRPAPNAPRPSSRSDPTRRAIKEGRIAPRFFFHPQPRSTVHDQR